MAAIDAQSVNLPPISLIIFHVFMLGPRVPINAITNISKRVKHTHLPLNQLSIHIFCNL